MRDGDGADCVGQMWGDGGGGVAVMARWSFSAVIGISVRRTPTASRMALPMAAAPGMTGGSPTPRTPNGPDREGISSRIVSIGGTLSDVGRA